VIKQLQFSLNGKNMDKVNTLYVTKEGLEKLRSELNDLVNVKRPEIAQRIKDAREMGDISENSEYDAARQEQSYIEGRISELEEVIKTAKVNEGGANKSIVGIGCKVTVHIDGSEDIFHIVGAPEANPLQKKISHESPLGSALVGKKIGDKIEVDAPIGKLIYTIQKIEY
jgi:transcription elongation factor GreA